ncbi:MAG: prepilin-type N-terminal cleavage/methylation domain-containing protein [Planctomycetes bacterium]|nr:prepilin-type N-terminal cleavage/methylation domain-containing protein [Planctomycetota bacterium]
MGQLRNAGFTLIEIMLALGVLGVGMVMIAAIFPAAAYQTREADKTTHAILICDNARTILQLKAMHENGDFGTAMGEVDWRANGNVNELLGVRSAFVPVPFGDDPGSDPAIIHPDDGWYPSGPYLDEFNGRQGWVALVRQYTGKPSSPVNNNDYQFIVVAYRKFEGMDYNADAGNTGKVIDDFGTWPNGVAWCDGEDRPALVRVSADPWPGVLSAGSFDNVTIRQDDTGCFVFFCDSANADAIQFVSVGSPVILDGVVDTAIPPVIDEADWGRFPTIVEISEDRQPDPRTGQSAFVARLSGDLFAEDDDPSDPNHPRRCGVWLMPGAGFRTPSPAIGASSFRTVLRSFN